LLCLPNPSILIGAAWEQGKNDIANCSGAALRIDIRTADERITIRGEKKEQEEKEDKG
jgi:hypothetical protein